MPLRVLRAPDLAGLLTPALAYSTCERAFRAIQEPSFPNALAYRFEVGGYTIVFESNQRIVVRTSSGIRVARAIRTPNGSYTIWALIPPSA